MRRPRPDAARLADARRSAAEKQEHAWKAVVPVAVAARYVEGKGAVDQADRRLAALQAQSAKQGCVSP